MNIFQTESKSGLADHPVKKVKVTRIRKLKGNELSGFPGVSIRTEAKPKNDLVCSIVFRVKLSEKIGNREQILACFDFAKDLEDMAATRDVGCVDSINITGGDADIVLMLSASASPDNYLEPAKNAFNELNDFLSNAEMLNDSKKADPVIWKALVRGTTIAQGNCIFEQRGSN